MRTLQALAFDIVAVVVFAVAGRASHASGLTAAGIAETAWPFLAAVVAGSLLGSWLGRDLWWRSGLVTWVVTVGLGIALRLVGGDTAQGGFVVVTAIVLAVLLIGWRLLAAILRRRAPSPS